MPKGILISIDLLLIFQTINLISDWFKFGMETQKCNFQIEKRLFKRVNSCNKNFTEEDAFKVSK